VPGSIVEDEFKPDRPESEPAGEVGEWQVLKFSEARPLLTK
jgi:hypothetical protein